MTQRFSIRPVITLALGILVVAGCSKSNNELPPQYQFQPVVINDPDNFLFQASSLRPTTTTLSYSWENSATRAFIDHSTLLLTGVAQLEILDANQASVYAGPLQTSLEDSTSVGTAGTWTVRVSLQVMQGSVYFTAEAL